MTNPEKTKETYEEATLRIYSEILDARPSQPVGEEGVREIYRAAAEDARQRGHRLLGVEARLGDPEARTHFGLGS